MERGRIRPAQDESIVLSQTVNYIADAFGFRAFVDSNEPGVKSGEYPPPGPLVEEYQPPPYVPVETPKPA